jgi:aerobic-type carbon monoxide dehydrogenase small subunit (CoxS/CutS family)
MPEGSAGSEPNDGSADSGERLKPLATRRDFLVGAGVGAVAVGVIGGGAVAISRGQTATQPAPVVSTGPGGAAVAVPPAPAQPAQPAQQPAQPPAQQQPQAAPQTPLPLTMRRVSLDIDGVKHDVTVDVRESLWESMTGKLGMASSNLGCDRAQCGACTIVVDGRAVNGCTVLTARLGRGQKILTVAGLAKGSGVGGLHPIQRAFWEDGGFQCGICTRGFIMSTYALLTANPKPTDDQISEALAGNICRCGEYVKIYTSVHNAAAEMRGEAVTHVAPAAVFQAPIAQPQAANAAAAAAPAGTAKQFEFNTPLATIEEFEPMASPLKEKAGILEVTGSERTITVKWDPSKIDEAAVRKLLTDTGHPVK